MKKLLTVLMTIAILFSCVGCGGPENPDPGEESATKIVIYAGGSSEFSWSRGSDEEAVYTAVQDKFKADTGISLDFDVVFSDKTMKESLGAKFTNQQIDIVVSHTGGGDGIDDWMFVNNYYYDLTSEITSYGANIVKYTKWTDADGNRFNALNRMKTSDNGTKILGFPSVINPYKFGILVRKDWMNALGYTDDATDTTKTLVDNFETFGEMALAMKEARNLNFAVTGAIFDLEKAGLIGAHGLDAGFYSDGIMESNGQKIIVPGAVKPEYRQVAELENSWAQSGVISKEADKKLLADGEVDFIGGKTGIFVQDPTVTHLITVARRTKKQNPEAEFTVLGALYKNKAEAEKAKTSGADKGFMRNSVATFGAVVYRGSENAENIVKFVNWMYSDVNNYLLCRYGIEGTHWEKEGENGYKYLGEYSLINSPYSGILSLVENQAISDLTYFDYTEEEKSWIETARNVTNYLENDTVDYFLRSNFNNNNYYSERSKLSNILSPIWMGKSNPDWNGFANAQSSLITSSTTYCRDMYLKYTSLGGKK